MSAEKDNLTGFNAFKFCGLANKQSLGLNVVKKGKKESIVLSRSTTKKFAPKRARNLLTLSTNEKKGLATLNKELLVKGYRRDLAQIASEKYVKLRNSFRKGKVQRRTARHAKK